MPPFAAVAFAAIVAAQAQDDNEWGDDGLRADLWVSFNELCGAPPDAADFVDIARFDTCRFDG